MLILTFYSIYSMDLHKSKGDSHYLQQRRKQILKSRSPSPKRYFNNMHSITPRPTDVKIEKNIITNQIRQKTNPTAQYKEQNPDYILQNKQRIIYKKETQYLQNNKSNSIQRQLFHSLQKTQDNSQSNHEKKYIKLMHQYEMKKLECEQYEAENKMLRNDLKDYLRGCLTGKKKKSVQDQLNRNKSQTQLNQLIKDISGLQISPSKLARKNSIHTEQILNKKIKGYQILIQKQQKQIKHIIDMCQQEVSNKNEQFQTIKSNLLSKIQQLNKMLLEQGLKFQKIQNQYSGQNKKKKILEQRIKQLEKKVQNCNKKIKQKDNERKMLETQLKQCLKKNYQLQKRQVILINTIRDLEKSKDNFVSIQLEIAKNERHCLYGSHSKQMSKELEDVFDVDSQNNDGISQVSKAADQFTLQNN